MKRAVPVTAPLSFLEILHAVADGRGDRTLGVLFVAEHRAQLEAHAAGLPTRHGHDAAHLARGLLADYGPRNIAGTS